MRKRTYKGKDGLLHVKRRRMSFKKWQAVRFEVWCRDKYRCVHCGVQVAFRKAHCDHILPITLGGSDKLENLRTLCIVCHSLRRDPSHDKLRMKSFKKGIIPKNFWELLWE